VKDGPSRTARISRSGDGAVSFCNHSADANCDFAWTRSTEITLTRARYCEDEEITIDYGDYADHII
jgi:hypothetical protein